MEELALERSGPERFLSCMVLFSELVKAAGPNADKEVRKGVSRLLGDLICLRNMSISVANSLVRGEDERVGVLVGYRPVAQVDGYVAVVEQLEEFPEAVVSFRVVEELCDRHLASSCWRQKKQDEKGQELEGRSGRHVATLDIIPVLAMTIRRVCVDRGGEPVTVGHG